MRKSIQHWYISASWLAPIGAVPHHTLVRYDAERTNSVAKTGLLTKGAFNR